MSPSLINLIIITKLKDSMDKKRIVLTPNFLPNFQAMSTRQKKLTGFQPKAKIEPSRAEYVLSLYDFSRPRTSKSADATTATSKPLSMCYPRGASPLAISLSAFKRKRK